MYQQRLELPDQGLLLRGGGEPPVSSHCEPRHAGKIEVRHDRGFHQPGNLCLIVSVAVLPYYGDDFVRNRFDERIRRDVLSDRHTRGKRKKYSSDNKGK